MYTVILLNRLSSELLKDHKFLFKPFIDRGIIRFCDWQENGTDVKTSVPDLYDCIRGRREWRAVVVNADAFTDYRDTYRPSDDNPFDFSEVDTQENNPHESPIPTVRISHILGGYNITPTRQFVRGYEYYDEETGKKKRVKETDLTEDEIFDLSAKLGDDFKHIYIGKTESEDVLERQKKLSEMYSFDDSRPKEIDFISAKHFTETDEFQQVSNSWKSHLETESSNFCERNMYPSNSRFMYFMVHWKDHSLYYRRLTEFWLAVLTISINTISASFLQAYRLYRLNIDIDNVKLQDEINENVCRLESIKNYMQEAALRASDTTIAVDDEVVEEQDILVDIESGDSARLYVNTSNIGLSRNCPVDERDFWRNEYSEKMSNLWKFLRKPRRSVDVSASRLKDRAKAFYGESYELDRFQADDLEEKMNELRWKVVHSETTNTFNKKKIVAEAEQINKEINDEISNRMTKKNTLITGFAGIGVYFIGVIPYLIEAGKKNLSVFLSALFMSVLMLCGVSLGAIIVLLVLKKRFVKKLKKFNTMMRRIVSDVGNLKDRFERYFTDVCTYMKASSIKEGMKLKKENVISSRYNFRRHIGAARACIERDGEWAAAFNFDMVIKSEERVSSFFDPEILPSENHVYYFPANNSADNIVLNNSGETMTGPYDFITKITIEKENIFDEGGSRK